MPAFSTCWNAHRHENGEHLINEILLLGFDAVEFSHGFGKQLFAGFRPGFELGRLPVSGAKFPCPADLAVNSEVFVDVAAVQSALQTVGEYHGSYLILPFPTDLECGASATLGKIIDQGKAHSRDYVKVKLQLIKDRESITDQRLPELRSTLEQLLPVAEACGVRIALENRAFYEQFPTVREIEALLEEFDSPWLGYWHDFGHAERQARLGFLDHSEQLERLFSRLIGCHIHDLVGYDRDHAIPGQGEIDFQQLIPKLPKDACMVWEIEPRRKSADIKAALADWQQKFPLS